MCLDVGEVRDPQPVRCGCPELALDEIGGPIEPVITLGGANPHTATPASLHAHVGHQLLDGATSDSDAVFVQLVPHLVRAIDDEVLLPHPQDLGLEFGVTNRTP